LSRLPWSVTCLSPTQQQGELLATQNPDGSLVFSAVLNEGQGLLSVLLVPPSPDALHTDSVTQARTCPVPRLGVYELGRHCLATARSPSPTFVGRWPPSFASHVADVGS
jgi:hypothetical protein